MKKIDLTNYFIKGVDTNGTPVDVPYDVKTSISNLLFNSELKLSSREIIAQDALAKKIESSDGAVLLEDAEYAKVKRAFDTFVGFDRNAVELVSRVENAETVDVKEK